MPDPIPKPKRQKPNAIEGTALVIVLSCLVLLAALAISLLNRVESDRSSSAAYRGGTLARTLAEYAINVVMAQITAATKADPSLAWASQPGAIRTYSASGSGLQNIYKLYSAPVMVDTAFPWGDITDLANWSTNTALYTDLNAPVVSGSRTNYPILDPGATNSVQGFAISGAPTTATQPSPMPVTWLYVLQDGTLVAPTGGSGNTVTVTGATTANPITGRIAFWADDDTCKININTASGMPWSWATNNPNNASAPHKGVNTATLFGNYWDIPVMGSLQDQTMAYSPPWRGEYQRFPGHPSTISLSAVYTNLSTNDIMAISPRMNYQNNTMGSLWGSVTTIGTSFNTNGIPSDGARLYANVDELLYATNRSSTNGPDSPLTTTQIEQGRFFLTASSRAPDVTLFNTPRLLVWPLNSNPSKRTPFDNLIAFVGTLPTGSANTYFFQRSDAYSQTVDYNANSRLLGYLRRMTTTAVPGFGGSGILNKSVYSSDTEQITTEIFDYIRCINLQDTSMGTTNSANFYSPGGLVVPSSGANNSQGLGRMPFVTKAGMLFWYSAASPNNVYRQVVGGITNTSVSTNGSAVVARMVVESFLPGAGYPQISGNGYTNVVSGLTSGFKWGVIPGTNTMINIFASNTANYDAGNINAWTAPFGGYIGINSSKSTNGAANGESINTITFIYSGGNLTTTSGTNIYSDTNSVITGDGIFIYPGGIVSATNAIYKGGSVATNTYSGFFSTGGSLTVKTYFSNALVQTINNINLPDVGAALPFPRKTGTNYRSWSGPCWDGKAAWSASYRNYPNGLPQYTITTNDVVRSVQIAHGDYRMSACLPTVDGATTFTNHPGYFSYLATTNAYMAHSFIINPSGTYEGTTAMSNGYYPSFPAGMTNLPFRIEWYNGDLITNTIGGTNLMRYSDFDNGYGNSPDGPYSGFSDEGHTSLVNNTGIPYFSETYNSTNVSLPGPGYFSPNRIVASAGAMGSLPTGVKAGNLWQTLLFRPAAVTAAGHPGTNNPPDYLLLDLFNMPVVEPYAISEPLSTAGRVNMNYQILPFTWIKRSTAVQAALHTERLTAISSAYSSTRRKHIDYPDNLITASNRFALDLSTNTGTLRGFEDRFATNDIFRSAAEICSIPLVPYGAGATYANMATWWTNYAYTGENSKERPYARIYPKLTTKSNTYTVHYRVEVLKKKPDSVATTWTEGADKVISTYRGSTTIERYVNPGDPAIIDYASQPLPLSAASALPYKFRILADRQFNP